MGEGFGRNLTAKLRTHTIRKTVIGLVSCLKIPVIMAFQCIILIFYRVASVVRHVPFLRLATDDEAKWGQLTATTTAAIAAAAAAAAADTDADAVLTTQRVRDTDNVIECCSLTMTSRLGERDGPKNKTSLISRQRVNKASTGTFECQIREWDLKLSVSVTSCSESVSINTPRHSSCYCWGLSLSWFQRFHPELRSL